MLMIRFQRIGRKNDPAFRIVVLEKTSGPKAGNYVDLVGTYNPKTKAVSLQADRIQDWVKKGAQVSPSLNNLLISQGVMEGTKAAVVSKKNLEKNKAKNEEAAAKAAADAKAAEEAANAPAPEPEAAVVEEVVETPVVEESAPVEVPAEETALPSEEEVAAESLPAEEETSAEAVEESAVAE
jgi:small subunit ribosomal protein S16